MLMANDLSIDNSFRFVPNILRYLQDPTWQTYIGWILISFLFVVQVLICFTGYFVLFLFLVIIVVSLLFSLFLLFSVYYFFFF